MKTELAARLWTNGVRASLDRWNAAPGFSLTHFMEGLVRENRFALVVCTPTYKAKADRREGGVGYETDLMTAARLNGADQHRFMAILRQGDRGSAVPAWLEGRVDIDLRGEPGEAGYEAQFEELLRTLHNYREQPPPLGRRPFPQGPNIAPTPPRRSTAANGGPAATGPTATAVPPHAPPGDDAVRIVGLSSGELRAARTEDGDGTRPITLALSLLSTAAGMWTESTAEKWTHHAVGGGPPALGGGPGSPAWRRWRSR